MTALNPPRGAAYDYRPNGVTLYLNSLAGIDLNEMADVLRNAKVASEHARRAWPPKAKLVPTPVQKSEPEPKSVWHHLLGKDFC